MIILINTHCSFKHITIIRKLTSYEVHTIKSTERELSGDNYDEYTASHIQLENLLTTCCSNNPVNRNRSVKRSFKQSIKIHFTHNLATYSLQCTKLKQSVNRKKRHHLMEVHRLHYHSTYSLSKNAKVQIEKNNKLKKNAIH